MPNRVLRDWTASDKVDQISQGAEVFFTRLIMKADDFGLYYGNPKLLNSALFPLKDYENAQVLKWLNECCKAGLIHKYSVDKKDYIQILGFDQRLRLMKSKFPDPSKSDEFNEPSNDGHLSDNGRLETKRNETESEEETETKPPLRAVVPDIFFGEDVQKAWCEWEQYRKEKKQKLTPSTAKKQMAFLGGRAGPEAIAIINQSILNGWTGLFELKQNGKSGKQTTDKRTEHLTGLAADFAKRASEVNNGG
jgi:hypothetical protein